MLQKSSEDCVACSKNCGLCKLCTKNYCFLCRSLPTLMGFTAALGTGLAAGTSDFTAQKGEDSLRKPAFGKGFTLAAACDVDLRDRLQ